MATSLEWHFAFDAETSEAHLRTAADVLERDEAWSGPWIGSEQDGELAAGLALWRLLGEREVQENVALSLSRVRAGLRWSLGDAGPLCALTDALGAPKDHPHHERVLDNAERCTRLAFELARELEADHALAVTDAGAPELWNAHVLFWRSAEAASRDLSELARRPLTEPLSERDGHAWRSSDQRDALSARLAQLSSRPAPTADTIRGLLASERFDVYRMESGFAVLEHPWYVNAFVDRFVLAAFGLEP